MKKWKISETIIDILYPPRCFVCHRVSKGNKEDSYLCPSCKKRLIYVKEPTCMKCGKPIGDSDAEFCYNCSNTHRYFDKGAALLVYDEVMKKSIYAYKDGNRAEYGRYYAKELINKYGEVFKSWDIDQIMPVPLSRAKLKKRGYNQALIIAKELGKGLNIPVNTDLIIKNESGQQKSLDFMQREKNSKKAFILSGNIVQSRSVLVVDDVFTTGSTINHIAELLKDAGCERVYFTTVCIGSESYDK